jgi:hypothetical protein
MKYLSLLIFLALMATSYSVIADRLPNQTPENQLFSVDTVIDVTGAIDDSSNLIWLITTPGEIKSGSIHNHNTVDRIYNLYPEGKVITSSVYKDSLLTNGGKMSENKNFGFNTKDKSLGLYNIESEKVLTYSSYEGAHMIGEEEYTLDVAGEAKKEDDNIRCVLSTSQGRWLPPFCNIVSTKSVLVNVNSAQISTKGQIRSVAKTDDIPAELNYHIAITPDINSESGFAEGTIKTIYTGSIMEGRGNGMYLTQEGAKYLNGLGGSYKEGDEVDWDLVLTGDPFLETDQFTFKTSTENIWKDKSEVTGGIKNFQKAISYKSGFIL